MPGTVLGDTFDYSPLVGEATEARGVQDLPHITHCARRTAGKGGTRDNQAYSGLERALGRRSEERVKTPKSGF